jgi:hypothetical protein
VTDPATQLDLFREAVRAIGGTRVAARELAVNERTVVRLCAGQTTLHDGFLGDMAKALRRHVADCRELERKLDPAFHENLYPGQKKADGRHKRGPASWG